MMSETMTHNESENLPVYSTVRSKSKVIDLRDLYISPDAVQELRNWFPSKEQADAVFAKDKDANN